MRPVKTLSVHHTAEGYSYFLGFLLVVFLLFGDNARGFGTDSLSRPVEPGGSYRKPGFGFNAGYGFHSGASKGAIWRIFYDVPMGAVTLGAGATESPIDNAFFGFDIIAAYPVLFFGGAEEKAVFASFGFNALVWSNTVTLGVPLSVYYHFPVAGLFALEPGIVFTPNVPLTKEKTTITIETRIGIRF